MTLIVDTANVQMHELEKFAVNLGFEFNPENLNFIRFAGLKNKVLRANTIVSANTMVKMYNDGYDESKEHRWVDVHKLSIFDLDGTGNGIAFYKEDVEKAYKDQKIARVKLQFNPKRKEMTVLNQMLEFYEPTEEQDFLRVVKEYEEMIKRETEGELQDESVEEVVPQVDGVLENWIAYPFGGSRINGKIYGDSKGRFNDGDVVTTSSVVEGDIKEGSIVKTRNSSYRLGKPALAEE